MVGARALTATGEAGGYALTGVTVTVDGHGTGSVGVTILRVPSEVPTTGKVAAGRGNVALCGSDG